MEIEEPRIIGRQPALDKQEVWPVDHILEGKYKVVELLEVTWRSEVYLVQELQPPYYTLVAKRLKVDKIGNDDSRTRFEREIIVLRKLSHQCVLSLHDSKTTGLDRYFVTEYADTGTLKDYLADRADSKLGAGNALDIALSVCQGLEAAHRKGIVHRDVKPGNIFLFSQRDGGITAKLGDFSIARVPAGLGDPTLTEAGSFIGTASYASPEQIRGGLAVPQSDLYSWAMVFFEMLTGEPPTESLRDPDTFRPVSDRFLRTFFTGRGIPLELVAILQQNLSVDQALRSQSATEVLDALEIVRDEVAAELETRIEQHLDAGEAYIRSREWEAAGAEFRQGMALCKWHDVPGELPATIAELANWLRPGQLCARGMTHLAKQQWEAAIETLESLYALVPNYLGLDIAAILNQAKAGQSLEQMYGRLVALRGQGAWTEILSLTDIATDQMDGSEGELVGDIRKLALYAQGATRLDEGDLESAYDQFFRLYQEDPTYEDIAERCVAVAFRSGTEDTLLNSEDQVKWLERVIKIEPDHNEWRTRHLLDEARYRWAKELIEGDKDAAAAQLERISPGIQVPDEARLELAQMCSTLGDQSCQ